MAQGGKTEAVREDELSFEQILEQLENVVEALERGDAPLEQALSTFERGVALSRMGARRLDEAERRIEMLMSDERGVRTIDVTAPALRGGALDVTAPALRGASTPSQENDDDE